MGDMKSMTIVKLCMTLLSSMVGCHQYPEALHLINRLNEFFLFDHHIFYVDSEIDLNSWLKMLSSSGTTTLPPQSVYSFEYLSPSDIVKLETFQIKPSNNPFLVVVVERLNLANDSELMAHIKLMRTLDRNVKIGVFLTRPIHKTIEDHSCKTSDIILRLDASICERNTLQRISQ